MRELYHELDLGLDPLLDMNLPTAARHNRVDPGNVNPALIDKLKSVNLFPANGAIFYSPAAFKTDICHVDCFIDDPSADWPSIAKLNFVAGDKNTLSMWYEVPAEKRSLTAKLSTSISQPFQSYNLRHCINISTFSPFGWNLFEAGVPHTVANPTPNPKWTISFVMRDATTGRWISYNECKEKLSLLNN